MIIDMVNYSGGHIESDILNIDIFCKYRYRIETGEKISIIRYVHMTDQKEKKSIKKKGAVKILSHV